MDGNLSDDDNNNDDDDDQTTDDARTYSIRQGNFNLHHNLCATIIHLADDKQTFIERVICY